jgi:hypothetical protein
MTRTAATAATPKTIINHEEAGQSNTALERRTAVALLRSCKSAAMTAPRPKTAHRCVHNSHDLVFAFAFFFFLSFFHSFSMRGEGINFSSRQ